MAQLSRESLLRRLGAFVGATADAERQTLALRRVAGSSPATSSSRGVPLHQSPRPLPGRGLFFLFGSGRCVFVRDFCFGIRKAEPRRHA